MNTEIIRDNMEQASRLIREGRLVAVPTETVYGLAGSGLNEKAVAEIYEVKGRPAVKPLSLMVPGVEAMEEYGEQVPRQARKLAERFWPGPLTIVLRAKAGIPPLVRAGGSTVGLRCPDHPLTLQLLRVCGLPLAAPSANPSGRESPQTAEKVLEYFDGKISAVIDGGPCGIGRESTLIDMSAAPYRILREGALSEETISAALAEELTVIGITGGSGCGKTTALKVLEEQGALVLDCDAIYHELLENDREMNEALTEAFPGAVRGGVIMRREIARIVFASPPRLEELNRISHRFIRREVERRLRIFAMEGGEIAAIDAVELIASGLSDRCRAVVGILSDREIRLRRIMERDSITREAAESRLNAQKTDDYYRENCTDLLFNNAGRDRFEQDCRELFKEIIYEGRSEKAAAL